MLLNSKRCTAPSHSSIIVHVGTSVPRTMLSASLRAAKRIVAAPVNSAAALEQKNGK